jgi:hypothetical protein
VLAPQTSLLPSVRFRDDDGDTVDTTAPIVLPQDMLTFTLAASLGASNTTQNIEVDNPEDLDSPLYFLVDAGNPNQEVVQLSATDNTVSGVFTKAHAVGTQLQQIVASFTKWIQFTIAVSSGHFAGLRFLREAVMPPGTFDHYRLNNGVYAPEDDTPMIGTSPVPFNQYVTIYAAPLTGNRTVPTALEIQWLFTSSYAQMSPVQYKYAYDQS